MRILVLTGLLAVGAAAQTPTEPPALIQLTRQPGLDSLEWRPYPNDQAPMTVLGMTAMTGVPETWLLETHDSFASIENLDQAQITQIQRNLSQMDTQSRFQLEVVARRRGR
jgi:hypothetical protein